MSGTENGAERGESNKRERSGERAWQKTIARNGLVCKKVFQILFSITLPKKAKIQNTSLESNNNKYNNSNI